MAVIGAGTVGAGIAQQVLDRLPGATVHPVERYDDRVAAARERARDGLPRCPRGADDPAGVADPSLDRPETSVSLRSDVTPELVVEPIPEEAAVKAVMLRDASAAWPNSPLATNTSFLSATTLAADVHDPGRFLATHFSNAVAPLPRTEIVAAPAAAAAVAHGSAAGFEKQSIEERHKPGLATSRLGVAIALRAIRTLPDRAAGLRDPIGPDVRVAIADHLPLDVGPAFDPLAVLREHGAAGRVGKKAGARFDDWEPRP